MNVVEIDLNHIKDPRSCIRSDFEVIFDTPTTEVVGFLFHRPQHRELRLTRSLGELLLQLFSTGLNFRMPYGIVSISGY
jgi:hypothetical protein